MKASFSVTGLVAGCLILSSCVSDLPENQSQSSENSKLGSEQIKLKSGATVTRTNGTYVWQDDILLSETQFSLLDETGAPFDSLPTPQFKATDLPACSGISRFEKASRACSVYPNNNLWAMVRFVYAPEGSALGTQLDPYTKYIIQQALRHWEAVTNVRFYNATGQPTHDDKYNFDYPYIYFCNGTGNRSYVSMIGGKQELTLELFATVGAAIHEIGHAVGLYHEHQRPDRDGFVKINLSNVRDDAKGNFDKLTKNYFNMTTFDFESIMLYSSDYFAKDPNIPTMTRIDGSTFQAQTDGLSDKDRQFANYFYYPYIARSDAYRELDTIMYDRTNTRLTRQQILDVQAYLNNGNPTPPANGRIENNF